MKKKLIYVPILSVYLLLMPFLSCGQGLEEINKQIISAISGGNAQELSKYFNSMVDCGITGVEDTYSKAQASRIIQAFFDKYPVKSIKISKKGTSADASQYSIGELDAGGKVFRLYYLLKKSAGTYLIQQFQIQEEH